MNNEDLFIQQHAIEFARKNKTTIAKKLTDPAIFLPDTTPVSVFMAGSPGAGKTEASQNLIKKFKQDGQSILRIDSDDLRKQFPEYNGHNSSLFIAPTSIIADKMHDIALINHQSFVFDGTLSNRDRSMENIKRSIKRRRTVHIVYIYQDPLQAWQFVKAREITDGRRVPKEAFIDQYFKARENVNHLKNHFKNDVQVDLVVKNMDGTNLQYRQNIDKIDYHIPEKYSKEELEKLIVE